GLFLIERPATLSSASVSGEPTAASGTELTPASNWRVPTTVALGLALIVVPMIALPKTDDYLAAYKRLAAMEEKDIALFNASLKQFQAGQINSQQYADILETQILPPWRAERQAMAKLNVSQDQAANKRLLLEYLSDREQGWQLTVEGLRTNDSDKLGQ